MFDINKIFTFIKSKTTFPLRIIKLEFTYLPRLSGDKLAIEAKFSTDDYMFAFLESYTFSFYIEINQICTEEQALKSISISIDNHLKKVNEAKDKFLNAQKMIGHSVNPNASINTYFSTILQNNGYEDNNKYMSIHSPYESSTRYRYYISLSKYSSAIISEADEKRGICIKFHNCEFVKTSNSTYQDLNKDMKLLDMSEVKFWFSSLALFNVSEKPIEEEEIP